MTDLALHIRIFEASPTDDFFQKRRAAIGAITAKFKTLRALDKILGLADALAAAVAPGGKLRNDLASQIESALKDASPTFVLAGCGKRLISSEVVPCWWSKCC